MFFSTAKQNGFSLSKKNKIEERKEINIGNDVFIGANVLVLDGVTIGDGVVIGAGAVVNKDIPPYAVAVGCPIRIVKYRFDEDKINRFMKLKWWDWNDERLKTVEENFFDVDTFLNKYS
jgi:acetyltransferase-like isoleucine patch superfamily enzyme